jgi:hypothetical protein
MKKLGYVVAALGALAIVAPTMASAETVVIKKQPLRPVRRPRRTPRAS